MSENMSDPVVSSTNYLNMLVEMGFPQDKAERALHATSYKSLEAAMDWILMNVQEMEEAEKVEYMESVGGGEVGEPMDLKSAEDVYAEHGGGDEAMDHKPAEVGFAGSVAGDGPSEQNILSSSKHMLCESCGKILRSEKEVVLHATKTGHVTYNQTGEVKPLSEEQKKEQVKKLEALIKQRRVEKEVQLKREAIEREKSRRKHGQELTEARLRLEEQEMKRLAEMKKREKVEARLARQKILEDIERDKQARRERFGIGSAAATSAPPPPAQIIAEPRRDYDTCRIQIRLTNGECLVQTFSANEELAAVRLYVELNRTDGKGPFSLMTSFPKKVFTEEDMSCPLKSLGLVPSAVLIVNKAN